MILFIKVELFDAPKAETKSSRLLPVISYLRSAFHCIFLFLLLSSRQPLLSSFYFLLFLFPRVRPAGSAASPLPFLFLFVVPARHTGRRPKEQNGRGNGFELTPSAPIGTPGGDGLVLTASRAPVGTPGGDEPPVGTPSGDGWPVDTPVADRRPVATPIADGCHM